MPRAIEGASRLNASLHQKQKHRYRYQKKIEVFIDQLQERLGIEDAKDGNDPSLSLTDAALLSPDAMQASIARCMLAAYPPTRRIS